RTQQIVAHETGVADTVDPLAGSYFVEALTDELEARATELIGVIDGLGGAVAAIEAGVPQRWIAESAYRSEMAVANLTAVKVGVNAHVEEAEATELRLFELDEMARDRQLARLDRHLAGRDDVSDALAALSRAAMSGQNVMEPLIEAARRGATLGELSDVFRKAFGTHREPSLW
ncbi:MAG: methylmalonyl-CoA mutase, partial [Acidimicrobiaceae bacterium]|nr:methylmalonyl-CoA mutase [Acidimicrobiaceae bacterium]